MAVALLMPVTPYVTQVENERLQAAVDDEAHLRASHDKAGNNAVRASSEHHGGRGEAGVLAVARAAGISVGRGGGGGHMAPSTDDVVKTVRDRPLFPFTSLTYLHPSYVRWWKHTETTSNSRWA